MKTVSELKERIKELKATGIQQKKVAEILNKEGFRTPKHGALFTQPSVSAFMRKKMGIRQRKRKVRTISARTTNTAVARTQAASRERMALAQITIDASWLNESQKQKIIQAIFV
jgi:hypothetical protein